VYDAMQCLKGQQRDKVKFELAETKKVEKNKRSFKLRGDVDKLAVALLDPQQSIEQVVMLQVCVCVHVHTMQNSFNT